MYSLPSIDMYAERELESELRSFFSRLRRIRDNMVKERSNLRLNRIQRARCKTNLSSLGILERDFLAISHPEDIRHVYRKVHRYVKLDSEKLMYVFGHEEIGRCSLFVAL